MHHGLSGGFENEDIAAVVVLTPHSLHARMVAEALAAGKHVFVEKPLCVDEEQLREIMTASESTDCRFLMVGYNRRFSPHAVKISE